MASPFSVFRKYQYTFLVVFGVILMVTFVIGPILQEYQQSRAPTAGQRDQSVVTWRGGSLNRSDLYNLQRTHQAMYSFLDAAVAETRKRGGQPKISPGDTEGNYGLLRNVQDQYLVRVKMLSQIAGSKGIVVTDASVRDFLRNLTDELLDDADFKSLLQERLGERELFDQLRIEIAYHRMGDLALRGISGRTPREAWEFFERLNRRVVAEVLPVKVSDYVAQVTQQPTDAEILELYEKSKESVADPSFPEPGFRQRAKIAFEYVKADLQTFVEPEMAAAQKEITDKEIESHYERNKSLYKELPADAAGANDAAGQDEPPEPAPAASSEPSTATDSPAKEPPAKEPPATEPPATEPPATEPPATEPPATEPPATEPPATEPPATEPPATEPPATEPPATEPPATEPPATEPPATEPPATEPPATEPPATEPPATEPPATESPATEPGDDSQSGLLGSPSRTQHYVTLLQEPSKAGATADQPAAEQPAEDSTAPTTAQPQPSAEPQPSTTDTPAEDANATPPAADNATPDSKPQPETKYRPLDDNLREKIRADLVKDRATQKARDKMNEAIKQVESTIKEYYRAWYRWDTLKQEGETTPEPTPVDVDALAKSLQLTAMKTPLVDSLEVEQYELGKSVAFLQFGMPTRFSQFGFQVRSDLYSPQVAHSPENFDVEYLYWKTKEQESTVPKLEDIRDQVVQTWKQLKARDVARQVAEQKADEARKAKKRLKELFASSDDTAVTETAAFSWLTMGDLPMQTRSPIFLSSVEGVDLAGEEFMRTVFALSEGEIGVAMNQPQSIAYVVRLAKESTPIETRRETFFESGMTTLFMMGADTHQRVWLDWISSVEKDLNVRWSKPEATPTTEGA